MQVFDLFVTKMLNLGIFTRQFQKVIVLFEIATLEFMKFQSFSQQKKLSSKTVFYVNLDESLKEKFSYLKLASWNLSKCKVSYKTKKCCYADQK